MKKLICTLALICSFAHAGTVAQAFNGSGGLIVLTDTKCTAKEGLVAYANDSTGRTWMGCWFPEDSFVFITWSDGDIRTYPYSIFTVAKKGKPV
jgi:hypothetical protein